MLQASANLDEHDDNSAKKGKEDHLQEVTEPISKLVGEFPRGTVVLILEKAVNYLSTNLQILKYLVNELELFGIYVTINRPYDTISHILEENMIDTQRLFFIDAITRTAGGRPTRQERIIYVASPQNLSEISIAVSELIGMTEGNDRFIFFDSLSTLTIYNTVGTVAKFAHFMVTQMRLSDLRGIILSLEQESDASLINTLAQFVDKVVRWGGIDGR
ncbi:MAG: hypothetical protein HYU39_02560 [Thaumarchaeota archaeon]|nr:hypothetical protein [Nitrososphaerota archaeon]